MPPGKVQCPFHNHHAEEEMFFILEGEGELRFGAERYPLRKNDIIACPPGGPDVAHQIINKTTVPISTGTAYGNGRSTLRDAFYRECGDRKSVV